MKDDSKFMKGQNKSLFLIALECSDTYYFKIYALFRALGSSHCHSWLSLFLRHSQQMWRIVERRELTYNIF
jgi:hypothetical protein